jgi:hypothetical protein
MSLQGLLQDSLTCLYVDDVRTSQETQVWAYTTCYGDNFNFEVYMLFVHRKKHTYKSPRPVTWIDLRFYM